jgi:glycosyltransferase involved in cell wall biosynthesis
VQVAALTGGTDVPSARFRVRQHVGPLAGYGVYVDEMVATPSVFGPKPTPRSWDRFTAVDRASDLVWSAVKVARRVPDIRRTARYDATWLSKGLLPGVRTLEGALKQPLVLDVDDAIWLMHPFGERAVASVAQRSAVVLAGNAYLAEWFSRHADDVRMVPTVVDVDRYQPARSRADADVVLGWSGQSTNFRYLYEIEAALERILRDTRCRLLVVADRRPVFRSLPEERVTYRPWSPETEVASLQDMDIGLVPMSDSPWARGKCGLKLLTHLACQVPVVASPVAINREILERSPVGLGASTVDEWCDAVMSLGSDSEARSRMGAAGRQLVEREFSVQAAAPLIAEAFLGVV